MTKLTKEEQIQAIYDLKVGYKLGHADIAMLKSMARQLLAGMEQEPVCHLTWHQGFRAPDDCEDYVIVAKPSDVSCDGSLAFPVYAAPQLPQPAVVMPGEMEISDDMNLYQKSFAQGHNACRAAMLQGNHRDLSYPVDPQIAAYEKIIEQAIPDGYALVPLEPTAEMIEATFAGEMELQSVQHQIMSRERRAHYYRAMLAAAPRQEAMP